MANCKDCGNEALDSIFCVSCKTRRLASLHEIPPIKVGDIVIVSMPRELSTEHDEFPGIVCNVMASGLCMIQVFGMGPKNEIVTARRGAPESFQVSWKTRT